MDTLIEIKNLTLSYPAYNENEVSFTLKNIDLSIKRGERILVLGPSGSGKSTLLHIITGVIPRLIHAKLQGMVKLNYSKIGIVLQNPKTQMISTTVEEEVAFGLENSGTNPKIISTRVEKILKQFNMEHLKKRASHTLSGGEAQMVAIAGALAIEPEILIMDEPASYLDTQTTKKLIYTIKTIPQTTTLIIVEHKWETFIEHIERIVILNKNGEIAVDTSKSEFLKKIDEYVENYSIWDKNHLFGRRNYNRNESSNQNKEIITIKHLSFSYIPSNHKTNSIKTFELKDITHTFSAGKTTVILGNNGAGKTTLLENIAGFFKQTYPYLFLNGTSYTKKKRKQLARHFNYIPQNPEYLFLKETVEEEIFYNVNKGALNKKDTEHKIVSLYTDEWNNKLSRNPFSLSEGEKRKLSLTILFSELREIVLMDEPTYGLDSQGYKNLLDAIYKLKERKHTVIIVSHDIDLVRAVADRIIIIENGKISRTGNKGGNLYK